MNTEFPSAQSNTHGTREREGRIARCPGWVIRRNGCRTKGRIAARRGSWAISGHERVITSTQTSGGASERTENEGTSMIVPVSNGTNLLHACPVACRISFCCVSDLNVPRTFEDGFCVGIRVFGNSIVNLVQSQVVHVKRCHRFHSVSPSMVMHAMRCQSCDFEATSSDFGYVIKHDTKWNFNVKS